MERIWVGDYEQNTLELETITDPYPARELKENIGPVPPSNTAPPGSHTGVSTAPPLSHNVGAAQGSTVQTTQTGLDKTKAVALPGAEEMAAIHKAKKANELAAATPIPAAVEPDALVSTSDNETKPTEKEIPQAIDTETAPQESNKEEDSPVKGVEGLQMKDEEALSKGDEAHPKDEEAPPKKDEETHPKEPAEPKVDVDTQEQDAKEPAAAGKSVED